MGGQAAVVQQWFPTSPAIVCAFASVLTSHHCTVIGVAPSTGTGCCQAPGAPQRHGCRGAHPVRALGLLDDSPSGAAAAAAGRAAAQPGRPAPAACGAGAAAAVAPALRLERAQSCHGDAAGVCGQCACPCSANKRTALQHSHCWQRPKHSSGKGGDSGVVLWHHLAGTTHLLRANS